MSDHFAVAGNMIPPCPSVYSEGLFACADIHYPFPMRYILSLTLLFLLAASPASDWPAKVIGISDGDTITVLTADKTQVRIRLYGIDATESGQDFGAKAKQVCFRLAFGKAVTVRTRATDRYGRIVADVILPDGRNLSHELVSQGAAWWYRAYARGDAELSRIEASAKAARRGLWALQSPIAPWNWRKGVGVPVASGVVGSRNSRIYHAPNCASVGRAKEANRIVFGTVAEAEKAGFRKARDCK